MEQSPSWEANSHSAIQAFPRIGSRRSITVFTRPYHWSLTSARFIQSTSYLLIFLRSILILSSHPTPRSSDGRNEKSHETVVGNPEGKRGLVRHKRNWGDNIKMNLKKKV